MLMGSEFQICVAEILKPEIPMTSYALEFEMNLTDSIPPECSNMSQIMKKISKT